MKLLNVLALLIALLSFSNANADSNSEVTSTIKSIANAEFTILSAATGDLNNDGLEDWAGIIKIKRLTGNFQQLYVLTRTTNNHLKFSEASMEVDYIDCGGSCSSEVSYESKSFYVTQASHNGVSNDSATTQFKFYKNKWRAIGLKTYRADFENDIETITDANLITGTYKSVWTKGALSGNPVPTVRKSGKSKPVIKLLKDLDLGQF